MGASLLEAALAVLLIGVVAIAAIAYFGNNTGDLWEKVPASFEEGDPGADSGGDSGSGSGGDSDSGGGSGSGGIGVCPPDPTDPPIPGCPTP